MPYILRKGIWEYHIGEVLANALVKTTSLTPNRGPTTHQATADVIIPSDDQSSNHYLAATAGDSSSKDRPEEPHCLLSKSWCTNHVLNKMAAVNAKVAGAVRKTTTIPFHLFSPSAPKSQTSKKRQAFDLWASHLSQQPEPFCLLATEAIRTHSSCFGWVWCQTMRVAPLSGFGRGYNKQRIFLSLSACKQLISVSANMSISHRIQQNTAKESSDKNRTKIFHLPVRKWKGLISPSSLRVALQISVTLLVKIHWGCREPSMLTAKKHPWLERGSPEKRAE